MPDITVITPIWENNKPIFFVASRGHHADIGGSTPGSMPPFSRSLADEGVAVKSFVLVKDNVFKERELVSLLTKEEDIDFYYENNKLNANEPSKTDSAAVEKK